MEAVETVHKLQGYNNNRGHLELAFFEWLFEFFEVWTQQLHHKVVIVRIWTIRKEPWKPYSSIFCWSWWWDVGLSLLLLQSCIKLDSFWILIRDEVLLQRLSFSEFHHILHQTDFSLKLAFILTGFLHLYMKIVTRIWRLTSLIATRSWVTRSTAR